MSVSKPYTCCISKEHLNILAEM